MSEPPMATSGVTNANGPKVDARDVPRACPPQERSCGVKLAICWELRVSGATAADDRGGENASGADNQQERPGASGRSARFWNPQRPNASHLARARRRYGPSHMATCGELERNSLSGKFRPARMV